LHSDVTPVPLRIARIAALAMVAATTMACRPPSNTASVAIDLAVPDRANATSSIAAHGPFAIVVWSASAGGVTDIYGATSRDGGANFSAPTRINDTPGDARANGEQPPRVVVTARADRDPLVTVVWTTRRPSGTLLLRSSSDDGGRSFTPAEIVAGSDAPGNRGWHALAADARGRVLAAWLDHRALAESRATAASHANHAGHTASGATTAQKSSVYFAMIDGVAPRPVAAGVCYCCKTAIAADDDKVYLAWRHVYPGDYRDMAFAMSSDGGKTFTEPQRVSADGWAIDGCPENGPTMVVDGNDVVHVAWPTFVPGDQPTLGLFYSSSRGGRGFSARQRVTTSGAPSHAQMALDDQGRPALVWDETSGGRRQVVVARSLGAGASAELSESTAIPDSTGGVYPSVAAVPNGLLVAWTNGTGIRVKRIDD
jgi:hypothetical protein